MVLSSVPEQLVAGDTWRWTKEFANYPAPTWVVTYYFENAARQFNQAAVASSTAQALTIAAAVSALLPPGRYRWFARAVSGLISETIEGENGWVEVLPDPAAPGSRDHRSFARRALDAVQAQLEGKASSGQASFSIRDRTVSSFTLTELWKLKTDLEAQVRTEEKGGRAGADRKIKVRLKRG